MPKQRITGSVGVWGKCEDSQSKATVGEEGERGLWEGEVGGETAGAISAGLQDSQEFMEGQRGTCMPDQK